MIEIVNTGVLTIIGAIIAVANTGSAYVSTQIAYNAESEVSGYSKEQCKDGGWVDLGFRNQGQCVSFFASDNANR